MSRFIELHRRFRDLTEAELDEPEILAQNEHKYISPTGWTELLKSERVLLLAEAGSGKTREMKEQVRRLVTDGKVAFFLETSALAGHSVSELLSTVEEASFFAWKNCRSEPAWFFLDAVDELKLTLGKLDQALKRLGQALGGDFAQVRVIISCRPIDWRPELDKNLMEELLPFPPKLRPMDPQGDDERFLGPLRQKRHNESAKSPQKEVPQSRTVILLPMSSQQIVVFAEASKLSDPQTFLDEINRQNAWTFARRPQDLVELMAMWKSSGKLGTRTEQHEANISAKLRDDPERPDKHLLSADKARSGAERLALALTLSRKRTIRSPEQSFDQSHVEGVLDPVSILTDWTDAERGALLRRALFDPATYGRIRFHHRSVQEFLAASKLLDLIQKGMSVKALNRFLFDERYGEKIVMPSMRPIAAWLSLWNDAVRGELNRRQPEVLLSYGDPESLSIGARKEILRSFVSHYGKGGWRGFRISFDDSLRIAHPDLAETVRDVWGTEPANEDVRQLLVNLIRLGPIEACGDLALQAALNPTWDHAHRLSAVRALIACKSDESVLQITQSFLKAANNWPQKMAFQLAPELFPKFLTVNQMVHLLETIPETGDVLGGFGWNFRGIAENLPPTSPEADELRDRVAQLIWQHRDEDLEYYSISSAYAHLTPGLAILCERQLKRQELHCPRNLIFACVIACRLGTKESFLNDPVDGLRALLASEERYRSLAFWADLDFMDKIAPETDHNQRFWHLDHDSVIGSIQPSDYWWLEEALRIDSQSLHRPIALIGLMRIWGSRGRNLNELEPIHRAIAGDDDLNEIYQVHTAPLKLSPDAENRARKQAQFRQENADRENKRLQDWKDWRDKVKADPAKAFSDPQKKATIRDLYKWLSHSGSHRNKNDVWDSEAIRGHLWKAGFCGTAFFLAVK